MTTLIVLLSVKKEECSLCVCFVLSGVSFSLIPGGSGDGRGQ